MARLKDALATPMFNVHIPGSCFTNYQKLAKTALPLKKLSALSAPKI
jgi:hypothetical protein